MKLLVDMNLSRRWVKTLPEAGIEASRWSSLGPAHAPDAEIMATQGAKPSVVQIRAEDARPETLGPTLIEALRQMAAQLEEGTLLTVDPARSRLRVQPLSSK